MRHSSSAEYKEHKKTEEQIHSSVWLTRHAMAFGAILADAFLKCYCSKLSTF